MTMHPLRRLSGAAALLAAALLASCESPTGGGAGAPARMDVVAGDLQTATAGAELPQALVVRVLDDRGHPVRGQIVNFVVTAGGGAVFAGSAATNQQGEARERWTLGTVASDTQRVEVRAVDAATGAPQVFAVFRAVATPDAPATITPVNGASYIGIPGFPLADSMGARVTDRYGNRISGLTVAWTVQRGGGSVSPTTSLTDTSGVARAQWMLGASADTTHVLQAAAGVGLTTAFTASSGVPAGARLAVVSGDAQTGMAGRALAQPLVVKLTLADGRPVPGATIAWSVSGGTVTPSVSTTDAAGQATAQWVLPSTAGAVTATASTPGVIAVGFNATSTLGPPATLEIVSGDNQRGLVRERMALPLVVRLLDSAGNLLHGVPVDWDASDGIVLDNQYAGTGTRLRTYTTNGVVLVHWGLGSQMGAQTLTATAGGLRVTFHALAQNARVEFLSPLPGSPWGDLLPVSVNVVAGTDITQVTARVADRMATLTLEGSAGQIGRYNGLLRLSGVPRGPYEMVVTVHSQGQPPAIISMSSVVDRGPVVRVEAPTEGTISSTGRVRVRATCEDDDPAGCADLYIYRTSIHGTSVLDTVVTLTTSQYISVIGRDSRGQQAEVVRWIYVETKAPWTEVAEVPGRVVVDTDGTRVLFDAGETTGAGPLRLLTVGSGATVTLSSGAWTDARVTPQGAVWMSGGRTYELRNGSMAEIADGGGWGDGTLRVAGSWAVWYEEAGVMRRDLATGATVRVGMTGLGTRHELGVAPNGDVVWMDSSRVARYRDGAVTFLTIRGTISHPVTDGINTAYNSGGSLVLTGPDGTMVLNGPGSSVLLRNGWAAFTRTEAGVPRVHTRSPSGEVRRVSEGASAAWGLGPAGEVIFESGSRLYYTAPPYATARDVGFPGVRIAWPGEVPYALLGRHVFRIDP